MPETNITQAANQVATVESTDLVPVVDGSASNAWVGATKQNLLKEIQAEVNTKRTAAQVSTAIASANPWNTPVGSDADVPSSPSDADAILITAAFDPTDTFVDAAGNALTSLAAGDVAIYDAANSRWTVQASIAGPQGDPGTSADERSLDHIQIIYSRHSAITWDTRPTGGHWDGSTFTVPGGWHHSVSASVPNESYPYLHAALAYLYDDGHIFYSDVLFVEQLNPPTVTANPSGAGTSNLTKLQIGSTIYSIPQGGGGGGGGGGADLSDDDPLAPGQASPGASDTASRSDHVHPRELPATPAAETDDKDYALRISSGGDATWVEEIGDLSNAVPAQPDDSTGLAGTSIEASRADHKHPLPSEATSGARGLMSSGDKSKLDTVLADAQPNNLPDAPAGGNAISRYKLQVAIDGTETWETSPNDLPRPMDTPSQNDTGRILEYNSTTGRIEWTDKPTGGGVVNNTFYQLEPEPVSSTADIPTNPADNDAIMAAAAFDVSAQSFVENDETTVVATFQIGDVAIWDSSVGLTGSWIVKGNIRGPAGQAAGVTLSDAVPQRPDDNTGAAGQSGDLSRADHKHPLPAAATSLAEGLMSAADKAKIDTVAENANANAYSAATPLQPNASGGSIGAENAAARGDHRHPLPANASDSAAGLMSAADKTKLDGVSENAAALGSVVPLRPNSATGTAGISVSASRQDHRHPLPSNASASEDGLMSSEDKAKLDGIVTDSGLDTNDPSQESTSVAPSRQAVAEKIKTLSYDNQEFDLGQDADEDAESWRLPVDEVSSEFEIAASAYQQGYSYHIGPHPKGVQEIFIYNAAAGAALAWIVSVITDGSVNLRRIQYEGAWLTLTEDSTNGFVSDSALPADNRPSDANAATFRFDTSLDGSGIITAGAKLLSATPEGIVEYGVEGTPADGQIVAWDGANTRPQWQDAPETSDADAYDFDDSADVDDSGIRLPCYWPDGAAHPDGILFGISLAAAPGTTDYVAWTSTIGSIDPAPPDDVFVAAEWDSTPGSLFIAFDPAQLPAGRTPGRFQVNGTWHSVQQSTADEDNLGYAPEWWWGTLGIPAADVPGDYAKVRIEWDDGSKLVENDRGHVSIGRSDAQRWLGTDAPAFDFSDSPDSVDDDIRIPCNWPAGLPSTATGTLYRFTMVSAIAENVNVRLWDRFDPLANTVSPVPPEGTPIKIIRSDSATAAQVHVAFDPHDIPYGDSPGRIQINGTWYALARQTGQQDFFGYRNDWWWSADSVPLWSGSQISVRLEWAFGSRIVTDLSKLSMTQGEMKGFLAVPDPDVLVDWHGQAAPDGVFQTAGGDATGSAATWISRHVARGNRHATDHGIVVMAGSEISNFPNGRIIDLGGRAIRQVSAAPYTYGSDPSGRVPIHQDVNFDYDDWPIVRLPLFRLLSHTTSGRCWVTVPDASYLDRIAVDFSVQLGEQVGDSILCIGATAMPSALTDLGLAASAGVSMVFRRGNYVNSNLHEVRLSMVPAGGGAYDKPAAQNWACMDRHRATRYENNDNGDRAWLPADGGNYPDVFVFGPEAYTGTGAEAYNQGVYLGESTDYWAERDVIPFRVIKWGRLVTVTIKGMPTASWHLRGPSENDMAGLRVGLAGLNGGSQSFSNVYRFRVGRPTEAEIGRMQRVAKWQAA